MTKGFTLDEHRDNGQTLARLHREASAIYLRSLKAYGRGEVSRSARQVMEALDRLRDTLDDHLQQENRDLEDRARMECYFRME